MDKTLQTIKSHLEALIAQVRASVPADQPFNIAHGNWSFPGLTSSELTEEAQDIIDDLVGADPDEIRGNEARIADYARRLEFLRGNTVANIWSNSALGVPAFLWTLRGLRHALKPTIGLEGQAEASSRLRRLQTQLRGMEARYKALEPRITSLDLMVERIEQASDAADQLPTDLETLSETRQDIEKLARTSAADQAKIAVACTEAETLGRNLKEHESHAALVLSQCENAYSAATSVGLAAAFSERSSSLSNSMWIWVGGLVVALGAGSYFGSSQLHNLSGLISQPGAPAFLVSLNLLLAILSVGAPVWFAWLSTKQVGQRFRLAEDYAFKASISRAYEGFRRETARFDKDMEARLLMSALDRLDELPLRLVETETHGSPWHELAASENVRSALKAIPGFGEQVRILASDALGKLPLRGKAAPATLEGDQ